MFGNKKIDAHISNDTKAKNLSHYMSKETNLDNQKCIKDNFFEVEVSQLARPREKVKFSMTSPEM